MSKKKCITKVYKPFGILFTIYTNEHFLSWKKACHDYVESKQGLYTWRFHFNEDGVIWKRL